MKIHKQAQRPVPNPIKNTVNPSLKQKLIIEEQTSPSDDSIFLSSKVISEKSSKKSKKPRLLSQEITLKNGTQISHDPEKKTVRVTRPETPQESTEYTQASLQLPSRKGQALIIQNQNLEQRLFDNGGMILIDHGNLAHHLDQESTPKHRAFRTDEYHVFANGTAIGRQYTSPQTPHANYRVARHVSAWQGKDGNLQVPTKGNISGWNVLCPFLTQEELKADPKANS